MVPNDTILISGQLVAEFDDDASQFLAGEPEFVCTPTVPPAPPANDVTPVKPG